MLNEATIIAKIDNWYFKIAIINGYWILDLTIIM